MKTKSRVIFTQGGKGGVAKTEVLLSLIPWFESKGVVPCLLDFDIENTNKSGLKNFYPEAQKLDVHAEGSLDELFDACEKNSVVIVDLGAGAGSATYFWFDQAFADAEELGICFTSIGVTTNEAGAVQSVLKWGDHLQDRVEYLIVLNELREVGSKFEYWHELPAAREFCELLNPVVMTMGARIQELQSELRNWSTTLDAVIHRKVDAPFLCMTKNIVRARRYQRELFEGFERASSILL